MTEPNQPKEKRRGPSGANLANGMMAGIGVGIALGVSMDSIPMGIAFGIAIGIGFALAFSESSKSKSSKSKSSEAGVATEKAYGASDIADSGTPRSDSNPTDTSRPE